MKIEYERDVLEAMYLAKFVSGELYLRMFEIELLSGIERSELQRILPRLVKRGWIERKKVPSFSKWKPKGKVGQMEWVVLIDSNGRKRTVLYPKEILDEFQSKILRLKRTLPPSRRKERYETKTETYLEVVKKMPIRKQYRVLRQANLPFRGKTKLWKDLIKKEIPKQDYIFYKLLMFPYIIDRRVEGLTKLSTKEILLSRWSGISKKDLHFWKEESLVLKELRKWIRIP